LEVLWLVKSDGSFSHGLEGDLKKKCDKIAIATRLEDAASEKGG
jgi:hypothetical protein